MKNLIGLRQFPRTKCKRTIKWPRGGVRRHLHSSLHFLVSFPINDVIRMNERPKSTAAAAFVLQRIHLSLAVRRLSHNISIPSIKVTFNIVTVRKLCASEGYASFVNWAVFPISHDDDDLSRGGKKIVHVWYGTTPSPFWSFELTTV